MKSMIIDDMSPFLGLDGLLIRRSLKMIKTPFLGGFGGFS